MTMVGADAESLDRAVGALRLAADQLDADSAGLHKTLKGVTWLGAIATRFLALFEGQHQPRMHATAGFIRDAASSLQAQADQQRTASGATSGSVASGTVGLGTMAVAPSTRLDDETVRKGLLVKADKMLKNQSFQDRFPQGIEELRTWRQSFGDRIPTAEESAQFERYLAALNMANYQYRIVHDAAQMSLDEFTAMARAAGSSVGGAAGLGALSSVAGTILRGAADVSMGAIDSKVFSPTLSGLSELNATQFANVAAATMDGQLAAMVSHAKTTAAVMHTDPTKLAFTSYEVCSSKLDEARATGEIANSFDLLTGDGGVLDSVLRTSIHLVPGVGTVVAKTLDVGAIAGSSAQAGYHAQAGAMALQVALNASHEFTRFTTDVLHL